MLLALKNLRRNYCFCLTEFLQLILQVSCTHLELLRGQKGRSGPQVYVPHLECLGIAGKMKVRYILSTARHKSI